MTNERVTIEGNTFPVKEELKALGGQWAAQAKRWSVPAEREAEARALVEGAGPKQRRSSGLPHGELWQPCIRRGCDVEPSCVSCERCEHHCYCE